MRFKDTYRASPVAQKYDMPWDNDLFRKHPEEIPTNNKEYKEFVMDENIIIDNEWWNKQRNRCMYGFDIEDFIEPGGDALIDEIDAFWNHDKEQERVIEWMGSNHVIPPDSCYLPNYDLLINGRKVTITNRMYWYLNFWKIYRLDYERRVKDVLPPRFTDLDFLFFRRTDMMVEQNKDGTEMKSRQQGASEKMAGGVMGWNYHFVPSSTNIIAGGMSDDAEHTMDNFTRGAKDLINTQFYKLRSKSSSDHYRSRYYGSEVIVISCKDNSQALARYCLSEGTQVRMYNGGLMAVEDMSIGDALMGVDSTPRIVERLSEGADELYKISSEKIEPFMCNGNHLLYCYHKPIKRKETKEGQYEWVQNNFNDKDITKVDDTHFLIKAEDYYKKSKTFKRYTFIEKSSGIEYQKKKIDIDPYILGMWLGDGDSDMLRFTTADIEIVDYLLEYCDENNYHLRKEKEVNGMKTHGKAGRYAVTVGRRNSAEFIHPLKRIFVKRNLLKNKHIPDDFLYNTRDVRLKLLAGLIDTDGCRGRKKKYSDYYSFAQVDEKLTYQVKELCESLGFYVHIYKRKNGIINGYQGKDIHELYISGENISDVPVKIERKKIEKQKRFFNPLRSRCHIEKIGVGKYYGFTLTGDQLFLLKDYTITHNSPYWVQLEECFGIDTKIHMYDGSLKKIQDIKEGEYVKGGVNNKSTRVARTIQGTGSLYKIKQSKGKDYIVNKSHRLRLEQKINGEKDNSIKYLTVDEFLNLSKLKQKHTYGTKSTGLNTPIEVEEYGHGKYYGITLEAEKDEERVLILEDFTLSMNCGKWKKDLVLDTKGFITPALQAENQKTGWMHFIGTGGAMDQGASDMEELHYNPKKYNLLEYKNRWDRDNTEVLTTGHFMTDVWFKVIDNEGNSLTEQSAIAWEEHFKNLTGKDKYNYTTQHARYASDAFLIQSGGYFGEEIANWCNSRIAWIRTHRQAQTVERGFLQWKNRSRWHEGVYWEPDEDGPFMISEHPEYDSDGKPYSNLYKIGTDSYDQDEAFTSSSMGACWVKKGFLNAERTYNKYVAGLVERPTVAQGGRDVFYEHTALLTVYYGARNLIEHSNLLIFEWYERKGLNGLLKEKPEFAMAKMINKTQTSNMYGIDPSTKPHWLRIQADWLRNKDNIDKCDFIDLLQAWAKFKYRPGVIRYNCDITIASSLCSVLENDEESYEVVSRADMKARVSTIPSYKTVNGNLVMGFN